MAEKIDTIVAPERAVRSAFKRYFPNVVGLLVNLVMTGCSMQPLYQEPHVRLPAAWQAPQPPQPHGGSREQLRNWWARFDDPLLVRLIRAAEDNSPSLAQTVARIEGARAKLGTSAAAAGPSASGTVAASRALNVDSQRDGLDASWEIDLFGKLRKGSEAAEARLTARTHDWHEARVTLAAEVADTYVQFLGCRMLEQAYLNEAKSLETTERITSAAINAGLTARADGDLAQANKASARMSAVNQNTECVLLLKAMVALTSIDETELRKMVDETAPAIRTPAGIAVSSVPTDLLRQRPDLAALERTLAAAYADVGQADAERYPSLSLGGSITLSASSLLSAATTWSFGPTLSLPLFDGGKRKTAVVSAQALHYEALASYRNAVNSAVKEVELALARLDGAARRNDDAERAAQGMRRYFEATEKNWQVGNANLLTLEVVRRSAIETESARIGLQRDRLRYCVALYKALGGGWNDERDALASVPFMTNRFAAAASAKAIQNK